MPDGDKWTGSHSSYYNLSSLFFLDFFIGQKKVARAQNKRRTRSAFRLRLGQREPSVDTIRLGYVSPCAPSGHHPSGPREIAPLLPAPRHISPGSDRTTIEKRRATYRTQYRSRPRLVCCDILARSDSRRRPLFVVMSQRRKHVEKLG